VVSVNVCRSVCPRAYLPNYKSDLYRICALSATVVRFSSGGVAIGYTLPVSWRTYRFCIEWVVWGISIDTVEASGISASSCADSSATAASYWLHRVLDQAIAILQGVPTIGGGACNAPLPCFRILVASTRLSEICKTCWEVKINYGGNPIPNRPTPHRCKTDRTSMHRHLVIRLILVVNILIHQILLNCA